MSDEQTVDGNASMPLALDDVPKPTGRAAKSKSSGDKTGPTAPLRGIVSAKSKRYSGAERSERLNSIAADLSNGLTLKAATKNAGISEQTYYLWKRSAEPKTVEAVSPKDIAFADLIALEAENQQLRNQLAEKLRAENEELRKRLSLA